METELLTWKPSMLLRRLPFFLWQKTSFVARQLVRATLLVKIVHLDATCAEKAVQILSQRAPLQSGDELFLLLSF